MSRNKQLEFSVIAGNLKGRRIITPDLGVTRPPLTRLRKSIFDYLTPYLREAGYLDLFSGTGSYLFEAVSRGANKALGIELEPKLSDAVAVQASKFGIADRLQVMCGDVFRVVPKLSALGNRYDIIMIAPPQYKGFLDRTLSLLGKHSMLRDQGQIVCQHDSSETNKIDWAGFSVRQQRKYGNTTFTILDAPVT